MVDTVCTCSRLMIGTRLSEIKNLNPDYPAHGFKSEWYNSEEQIEKREKRKQRRGVR